MKSNFFKIVLPAFALMLAITASLAFTPAEDDITTQDVWFADSVLAVQLPATVPCNTILEENPVCTVQRGPFQEQVFYKDASGEPTIILYKDDEQ
ncbi:DUF6520 family protein [Flavivirga algicola]|uniref:Secreted protein n=1 Tax=Flavivirga algicola TaxID=2729136 RepID=A0ABX1S1D8_9FLAO|nr:DUF6520 family protein [Flavivirga algicola]NMH89699.1 hypothetical protein [Flavivirga algicola]